MTKILRKTCSSLVKIVSDGENNFKQNKCNKLQKISAENKWVFLQKISAKNKSFLEKNKCKSANIGSSTVQLHGVDLIDKQIQNWL